MRIYLNILPEEKKEKMRLQKVTFRLVIQTIAFFAILCFFLLTLIAILWGMHLQKETLAVREEEGNKVSYEKLREYDNLFTKTNRNVALYTNMLEKQDHYTHILDKVASHRSEKIFIDKIVFSGKNIELSGRASQREDILYLEDALKEDTCFFDVEVPLESLVQKENVSYTMTFLFTEDCYKEM